MTYYKVTTTTQAPARFGYYPFETGELLTAKELQRIGISKPGKLFEAVEINRNKIYFFFGKRFAL